MSHWSWRRWCCGFQHALSLLPTKLSSAQTQDLTYSKTYNSLHHVTHSGTTQRLVSLELNETNVVLMV